MARVICDFNLQTKINNALEAKGQGCDFNEQLQENTYTR